jgi:hypothetical protein
MTAPRKLYGVSLKPRAKIPPRRKIDTPTPEGKQEARDILRQVVEEHRALIERLADR